MAQDETRPLVSILIPCYNAERWIGQCLESALAQTYSPVEIIVVDDGSADRTADELRRYGDRIRYELARHSGANTTRNRLLDLATGGWLQYLDADDYLLPDKIAGQVKFLNKHDRHADVIYSPAIFRDEVRGLEYTLQIEPVDDVALHYIQWGPFCTHGMLLRRRTLTDVGGWKADQPVCQEHEMLLRLLQAGKRFEFFNNPACVYRLHGGAQVSGNNQLLTLRTKMQLTDSLEEHLDLHKRKTTRHRRALFAARGEAARVAYQRQPEYARRLMLRAVSNGHYWVWSSPALPLHYQIALRTLGFDRAENLASWWRTAFKKS
jgi:glycosyltransferase involved in cell wall biosynthesis